MADHEADRRPQMPALAWERPEPGPRKAPVPLSRDRIVGAAVAIADTEGLQAVSLRRVAARLGAGPMRLYGYVESKDDLLDLMLDAVYGEIELPEPRLGDWRAQLRAIAHATQRIARRHPWLVSLIGAHQPYGPNGLRYMERTYAALDGLSLDIPDMMHAVNAVLGYVIGFVQLELLHLPPVHVADPAERERQDRIHRWLARAVSTGAYPTLARVLAGLGHVDIEAAFEASLECVLDGVAAQIRARRDAGKEPITHRRWTTE